ncbi:MAG: hypothetical protein IPO37_00005 [Saprospiraceae bacterium]|nr:hypothetical protein [Saprospiraceae bacterium]
MTKLCFTVLRTSSLSQVYTLRGLQAFVMYPYKTSFILIYKNNEHDHTLAVTGIFSMFSGIFRQKQLALPAISQFHSFNFEDTYVWMDKQHDDIFK